MNKYTKIAYIVLILNFFLLGFFVYKVSGKNSSNENIDEKTLAEIKHLEGEIQNLFNQLNNISFETYKISSSEIKKEESKTQSSGMSQKASDKGGNSEKSGDSNESESSEEKSDSSEDNKEYKLEENGILNKDSEIDWNKIKNEVEKIYTLLYSTTLDLYQTSINREDIMNFNKEYDKLTKAVKEENKDDSLKELAILYNYLAKFVESCTDDEKEKTIINTKNNIFKAYSVLDKEEWDIISDNVDKAIQEFKKIVMNNDSKENKRQYNINKTNIMINELQNAITLKDKEVFLIKYKNLLEELQKI